MVVRSLLAFSLIFLLPFVASAFTKMRDLERNVRPKATSEIYSLMRSARDVMDEGNALQTEAQISQHNEKLFAALEQDSHSSTADDPRVSQVVKLMSALKNLLSRVPEACRLDLKNACYARASAAHVIMRTAFPGAALACLWITGTIARGGLGWGFHNVLVIRTRDRGWQVIDTLVTSPSSPRHWLKQIGVRFPGSKNLAVHLTRVEQHSPFGAMYRTFPGEEESRMYNFFMRWTAESANVRDLTR